MKKANSNKFWLGFFNGVLFTFAFLFFMVGMDEEFHFTGTDESQVLDDREKISIISTEEKSGDYTFQSQAELNAMSADLCTEYNDSIEKEFQILLSMLPQYKEELINERCTWKKYQNAVREVAVFEDYGSSTPMYVSDVLRQGILLREISFSKMMSYLKGKRAYFSKTIFTQRMINDAYSAYIKAIGENEYFENKADYQDLIHKEQKCWNEWMYCRYLFSHVISPDIKRYYDNCTNMVKRTKLFQLKNQNHALGVCGHEELECVLPEDCSDKALLNYPGFDIVWAKHCENTDWYPNFD